jgi:aspartyl-tRNA(Asn)/glutamyl-tRNA(Gln) amidotransferase subunit B
MNSFKGVRNALDYEIKRQTSLLNNGEEIVQQTRLWNADKGVTTSMRSKEAAHDYRYFPEPDLVPFTIEGKLIECLKKEIPELPQMRRARFISQYGIPEYDASVLIQEKRIAEFFEETIKLYNNPKGISNWIMGDISAILNEKGMTIDQTRLSPINLAQMVKMVDEGTISIKIAKAILPDMVTNGDSPEILVERKELSQISDRDKLEGIIDKVISENEKTVEDYKSGKKNALIFLIGQVMKATRGKANPKLVNEILKDKLEEIA